MWLNPIVWVELGRRDVEHLGVAHSEEFHVQVDPGAVDVYIDYCEGSAVLVLPLEVVDV